MKTLNERCKSPEVLAFLTAMVDGTPFAELARMTNETFGTDFTQKSLNGYCNRNGLKNNIPGGRFQKGQEPVNKGKKQTEFMSEESIERTKATRFQAGHMPHNHKEIGSERITKDGYIEIKVAEPKTWKLKHRIVWEAANGPIPDGKCLRFLDGNKLNCSLDNLALVTRAEHIEIMRRSLSCEDPEITQVGINIAKLNCRISDVREQEASSDMVGRKSGRLTVIECNGNTCVCKCTCGTEITLDTKSVLRKTVRHCGCMKVERHGMSGTRLYRIWLDMKKRCYNEYCDWYSDYGGRGIKVCREWKLSFTAFAEWAMSNGYSEDLTIERINVNGNYEPSNCRWATWEEQAKNKRNSKGVQQYAI